MNRPIASVIVLLAMGRPDLDKVKAEQSIAHESGLVGVDVLVIGSLDRSPNLDAAPPENRDS